MPLQPQYHKPYHPQLLNNGVFSAISMSRTVEFPIEKLLRLRFGAGTEQIQLWLTGMMRFEMNMCSQRCHEEVAQGLRQKLCFLCLSEGLVDLELTDFLIPAVEVATKLSSSSLPHVYSCGTVPLY